MRETQWRVNKIRMAYLFKKKKKFKKTIGKSTSTPRLDE